MLQQQSGAAGVAELTKVFAAYSSLVERMLRGNDGVG